MDHSSKYQQFRALLREVRESAGLTQKVLSERLGKPQTYVSKCELGERRTDYIETIEWCSACEIEPNRFYQLLAPRLDDAAQDEAPAFSANWKEGIRRICDQSMPYRKRLDQLRAFETEQIEKIRKEKLGETEERVQTNQLRRLISSACQRIS